MFLLDERYVLGMVGAVIPKRKNLNMIILHTEIFLQETFFSQLFQTLISHPHEKRIEMGKRWVMENLGLLYSVQIVNFYRAPRYLISRQ